MVHCSVEHRKKKGLSTDCIGLLVIAILLFVVVLPSVFATKPGVNVQEVSSGGIIIEYPKQPFYFAESNPKLHFHVYNSNVSLLTNSTTVCNIHTYNETGNHVEEKNLLFDTNGIDFYIQLNSSLYHRGEMSYIIWCNNTVTEEAGFVSTSITLSNDEYDTNASAYVIAIMLGLLGFSLFMSWFYSRAQSMLVYLWMLLGIVVVDVCVFMAMYFTQQNSLQYANIMYVMYYGMLIISFFVIMVILWKFIELMLSIWTQKKVKDEFSQYGYNYENRPPYNGMLNGKK